MPWPVFQFLPVLVLPALQPGIVEDGHGAYSTLEGVDETSLGEADECSDDQHSAFFTVETFKVENVLLQLSS